jgi:predicted N-acyltransferase
MRYKCRVFESIAAVDLDAWNRLRAQCQASIFMDPRFAAAVESGMRETCRFWYVVVYEDECPVACAGLTAMKIDLADFTNPRVAWIVRHIPIALSRFRNLKVLFCSLPGSPGEKCLLVAPNANSPPILAAIDATMLELAQSLKMDAVIYKEFAPADLEAMRSLLAHGYSRIEIPSMHCLPAHFGSFAEYCTALRARYRMQITRSTKKLTNSGIQQLVLTAPDEMMRLYTPDVHAMYRHMVLKSDVKVEVLPIEYYHAMVERLKGQLELVAFFKDTRVIAFGWCLRDATTYHMMYAGLDYSLNNEFDLYFNLMYAGFDRALRSGAVTINVGQTATVFKSRMGCYSEPRYIFAKGLGPLMSGLFYYGADLLVIKKPSNPPSDIFKKAN